MKLEFLYRYIDYHTQVVTYFHFDGDGGGNTHTSDIVCEKHVILSYTPKGCWIERFPSYRTYVPEHLERYEQRFVLDGANNPWAHTTKEAALKSFLIRKQRQEGHLTRQLANTQRAIKLAKSEIESQKEILK